MQSRHAIYPAALILGALALGAAGRPALARVAVTGGDRRQQDAVEDEYAREVPARFRTADTVRIELVSDRAMNRMAREEWEADGDGDPPDAPRVRGHDDRSLIGTYDPDEQVISLRHSLPPDLLASTFAHEYGHYVWVALMSRWERRRYGRLYDELRDDHRLISRYAATDRTEGFAEAFAYYVVDPQRLQRRDPDSFAFIDGLFRDGP